MKANELRIGNLVYNYKNEICQIKYFQSGESYSDGKKDTQGLCVYSIDKSTPIPLTEEWLIKLGCEKKINLWGEDIIKIGIFQLFIKKSGFYLLIGDEKFEFGFIEFVHEFQNLYFALTGQELEIK